MKNYIFSFKIKSVLQFARTTISVVILSLIVNVSGFGQPNYLFENLSIIDGLSNPRVYYIFQDSNGFLWISTEDGLNRYDGYQIKVFKNNPNDSTSIPNNHCQAITEDSDGFIWIGVFGNKIARYNTKDETFKSYEIETGSGNETNNAEFYSALSDQKGNLWFSTNVFGMQKFNKDKDKFEQVLLESSGNNNSGWSEINSITELKNGDIIASDYASGIKIYNEKLNLFQPYFLKSNYSPNQIKEILEEESGDIWFGGRNKLIKYSPSLNTTKEYDILNLFKTPGFFDYTVELVEDKEGFLWIGASHHGLYRFNPNTNNVLHIEFNSKRSNYSRKEVIAQLYKDRYGVIWMANLTEGLTRFDPLKRSVNYSQFVSTTSESFGTNPVTAIAGSPQDNEVTIATSTKGFFSYNLETKELIEMNFELNKATTPEGNINIENLIIDDKGNRWFTINNMGLHKIDRNNLVRSIKSPNLKKRTYYTTKSIKMDLEGNIWFASSIGFEKYNPLKNEFTLLPSIMNKQMSENFKQSIYNITGSREPVSSMLKVGEAFSSEKKFSLKQDQKVLIVCVGEGRIFQRGFYDTGSLMNNEGDLIWSMNQIFDTFNDGGGFSNRIAVKCLDLKKGDYKITYTSDVGHSYGNWNIDAPPDSSWYGIQVLNLNESEYSSLKTLNEEEISSDKFMPIGDGTSIEFSTKFENILWLGSLKNSFFKYDLITGNFKQYNYDSVNKFSRNNTIVSIYEDRGGIVWIATLDNLLRFDPLTEIIEEFNQKDGLPSTLINSIVEDLDGNLWINTSVGLSKLDKSGPKSKWNFVNTDTREGLQGFSTSGANWISKDGEMIFGSNNGVFSFYPGKTNVVLPDIIIKDIKISDISLGSDSALVKLEKSILKTNELHLSHSQNNISFEFLSIHYSNPEKNRLSYKLEGFDTNWKSTDRNYVSFTNLEPGEYTFRVKGSNSDGIWNNKGRTVQIIIHPPWWLSWWAYGIYFIILIVMVLAVHIFQKERTIRREKHRSQIRELEQAKEIEKAYTKLKATQSQLIQAEKMASLGELTAGIAHEIQNPLNFVNNFSEVSKELLDEMNEELDNGNLNEVKEIALDIDTSLEKINHHGKRAEAIVKGMLQHSRKSSGEKELTDINALADEYLRLSYHGLRSKDKKFNVDIKKDFDDSIPKTEAISQDIGRVLLNILNNALYACNESGKRKNNDKDKANSENYWPTIVVSTKKVMSPSGLAEIEIRVKDNGDGIPRETIDKIFQPFYTTKPTGKGTGLGLSISYDIVKAHGGEMKVISEKNIGAEFIVNLPITNE